MSRLLHRLTPGLLAAMLAATLLAGCRDVRRANGTALFLRLELSALARVDQVRIAGTSAGAVVFEPLTRPEPLESDGGLSGTQSLRLLLEDTLGGQDVVLHAEALAAGVVVSTVDTEPIPVRRGYEVDVDIAFGAPRLPDGGEPTMDGGFACGPSTCAGCCQGNVCYVNSTAHCGGVGAACAPCDGMTSNTCNAGVCQCGADNTCGAGSICSGGACVCDSSTCGGCCAAGHCFAGSADSACGAGGQACVVCTVSKSVCASNGKCK